MTWHEVDVAGGEVAFVEKDGWSLVIAKVGEEWVAFEDRCTHAGCAFSRDGEIDGGVVICNCHGSEFDLRTGAVLRPPAESPLYRFETRMRDGKIELRIEGEP